MDGGIDRRRFLGRLGSGAIAVWMAGTTCDGLATGGQTDTTLPGHFGRMFHLPPFAPQTETVREALLALGEPGGIMDAQDDLAAGPVALIIAERMGLPPLAAADLAELQPILPAFVGSTPLFCYILKEAEVIENGARLGPVGGRMVAEVVIGLLQTDPTSYVTVQPAWVPTLPTRAGTPQGFRMTDFLTFARVDPASRGQ
jgi:hypothetical protein